MTLFLQKIYNLIQEEKVLERHRPQKPTVKCESLAAADIPDDEFMTHAREKSWIFASLKIIGEIVYWAHFYDLTEFDWGGLKISFLAWCHLWTTPCCFKFGQMFTLAIIPVTMYSHVLRQPFYNQIPTIVNNPTI